MLHKLVCAVGLVLALTTRLVAQPPASTGTCRFEETPTSLVLSNGLVEIRLDRRSGVIVGLRNRVSGVEALGHGSPDVFRLDYSTFESHGATPGDLWTAGYGAVVHSSKQTLRTYRYEPTSTGGRLTLRYDSLSLGRRRVPVFVGYTVELRTGDEETRWRISIDNRSPGTVREVHFPIAAGLTRLETLIMPNHGGQKLTDPLTKLSDETPNVYLEYPARASMQWFDYFSPETGLYLASYDQTLAYTRLYFGRMGTGERPNAAMWLVKYPFVATGGAWQSPDLALGLHAGDWHWGADRYRAWHESWVPKPQPPKRIAEMTGGEGGMYVKERDETTSHPYEDLVKRAEAKKTGTPNTGTMLIGWFYNGHDTYFPEYNAIPELGGDKALIAAVDQLHALGGYVNAYMNGRIANIETQTYKTWGKRWAVLGRTAGLGVGNTSLFELHEDWNKAWERSKKGEGWFSVMCPSARGWQDHLVGQVLHGLRDYHFDGIFLDQPGSYYAELCYNPYHGHATPAAAWGPGQVEIFGRIRREGKKINPEFAIWSEGMNDVFGQFLDFHTDKNPLWAPMRIHPESETFVEMWRYALPWYITQNGWNKYSLPASKDPVYGDYYRFLLGIRGVSRSFDVLWKGSSADSVARLAVVDRIETLWRKGGEFFFYGTFRDDVGLRVSTPTALAKAYATENAVAVPVWNTTNQALTLDLGVDLGLLLSTKHRANDVTSLETATRLPFKTVGTQTTVRLTLPPHQVAVVVVKTGP